VYFVIYIQFFPYCLFVSNSQVIGREDCLRNDLYCVGWGVKFYSVQSEHFTEFSNSVYSKMLEGVFWHMVYTSLFCRQANHG